MNAEYIKVNPTKVSLLCGARSQISFDIKWNRKNLILFLSLIVLPNLLGLFNLSTPWGFKIHFFQLAIFIAAAIYGPKGGALSGLVGSIYSAIIMSNPYLLVGNVILGFFVGLFVRLKLPLLLAVLFAYCLQLPWLIITDYYLVHLEMRFIIGLILSLAASNIIWGIGAHYLCLSGLLSKK